jgi:NTP pyrophosphatase (non-canonical NTP hydrolase)
MLNELAEKAYKNAVEKGFYDNNKEFGTLLMQVTGELSEALEADRKGGYCSDQDIQTLKHFDKTVGRVAIENKAFEMFIKNKVQDELTDALIILLGICRHKNMDIDWHVEQKMKYNEGRSRLHGKKY